MFVNTTVVRALMTLRGFTRSSLAKTAGVREDNLRAWLADSDSSDLCMAKKNQILVLRALGIEGELPRPDTVHAWLLDESSRSGRQAGLDALQIVLEAFGKAEVIHFGRDTDPVFTFSEDVFFGLRFSEFRVVLRVKPGFLRDVQFAPESCANLEWAKENAICMLPEQRYQQIVKSDVTSSEFEDYVRGQVELEKWESLHLLAREHNIGADSIAKWLFAEVQEREARTSLTFDDSKEGMLLEADGTPVNESKGELSNVIDSKLFINRAATR